MAQLYSRAVQPMHWAGMSKVPGGPMVCGACPTPEACDAADRCARASDEDYDHMPGFLRRNEDA